MADPALPPQQMRKKAENTKRGFKTISLQAVHLLPAVCPGEQGGTGGPPGRPICPGRGPRPRGGGPASPLGGAGILGMGARASLTCRDPARGPRAPAHCSRPRPRWAPSHNSSKSIWFAPYSDEFCHCVKRKRGDALRFQRPPCLALMSSLPITPAMPASCHENKFPS